ncbi:MAG TPA: hypothetical protein VFI88_02380 [Sphingomicrobium sp.]|jgi:hypothetical protein|nr:hypothetical protein [Sphingomicrobium sp.]
MATTARQRCVRTVAVLFVVYFGAITAAITYFRERAPDGAEAYFTAILPALPIIGIFYALARYLVEESDEYQRMKLVRAALIATGFMLTVTTVWGFLESFNVVSHIGSTWVTTLWFAGFGAGGVLNRFTYGDSGC